MPRGKPATKRKRQPDKVYNDIRVARLINYVMLDGKKDKARQIVYRALDQAAKDLGMNQVEVLDKVIETLRPEVEVRPRRVGGATYQIPVPVTQDRGEALALRWLIEAARNTKGKAMQQSLAQEMISACHEEGVAFKKKENVIKMAEANRAFAHFRW